MASRYQKPAYLPVLRELVRAVQTFERYSAAHVEKLGFPPAQFDIVATLGDTTGMTFKELGEKTLITKGTLTGVVDRLVEKGVVRRVPDAADARKTIVRLTAKGQRAYERAFPVHIEYLRLAFDELCPETLARLGADARKLREAFEGIVTAGQDQK